MGRPLKIAQARTSNFDGTVTAINPGYFNNPEGESNTYGVVGGNVALAGDQVVCRAKIGSAAEGDGYIVRQKGSRKFLVTVGADTGVCVLVDKDNGSLAAAEMTVVATDEDSVAFRLARISNRFGIDFDGVRHVLTFNAADADKDVVTVDGQ